MIYAAKDKEPEPSYSAPVQLLAMTDKKVYLLGRAGMELEPGAVSWA
jgi:hypothetical protein